MKRSINCSGKEVANTGGNVNGNDDGISSTAAITR